ncbi:LOW QUALITY PROTEIN: hypothetical protein U0070_023177 [Myodes glareolus]|uniref:Uncharacterized protein n=1 Tax=Myodes glareolus TaxID=447135 RepID=A0AAW0IB86_MYOGA
MSKVSIIKDTNDPRDSHLAGQLVGCLGPLSPWWSSLLTWHGFDLCFCHYNDFPLALSSLSTGWREPCHRAMSHGPGERRRPMTQCINRYDGPNSWTEAKPWGLAIRHLRVTVRLFLVTHEVINREHHLADFTVEARLVPCLEGTEKKQTVSGLPPDSGLTDFKGLRGSGILDFNRFANTASRALGARGRFAEGNLEVTFLAGSSVESAAGQFCRENSTGSLRAAERLSRTSQSDPKPGGDPSLPARPGRKGLSRGRRALPRVARFPRVVRAAPPGPRLPLPLRPLGLPDFYFRFPCPRPSPKIGRSRVLPPATVGTMADDQNYVEELENVDSSSEDSVDAKPDRTSIISSIMRYVFSRCCAHQPSTVKRDCCASQALPLDTGSRRYDGWGRTPCDGREGKSWLTGFLSPPRNPPKAASGPTVIPDVGKQNADTAGSNLSGCHLSLRKIHWNER